VRGSEFIRPSEQEAEQIHRQLARCTAHGQPRANELARTMLDIRHAVDLVRHERVGVVSAAQLLQLAVTAGRERALRAQGAALIIADAEGHSTVYRPISEAEARDVRIAARKAKEGAIRLYKQVMGTLAPHAVMADWGREDGYGVAVDVIRETVSVQWWPASLPGTRAL